jgi:hypothetical protein
MEMYWNLPEPWKTGLSLAVDKDEATLVYRIAPKGDYDLKYHGRNWRVAHNKECAYAYRDYWALHPKRKELHDLIKAPPIHKSW